MKILNKEIEFSFTDGENIEKLENATEIAKEKISKINQNQKSSIVINKTYDAVSECLDTLFGDDFSIELFNHKKDFRLCVRALNDLICAKNEQDNELDNDLKELQDNIDLASTRYSANRATRRAKK